MSTRNSSRRSSKESSGSNNLHPDEDETNMTQSSFLTQLNAARFPGWMALTVFSAICLAALNAQTVDRQPAEKWVLAATIISMTISLASVSGYLCWRHLYVGLLPEMIVTGFLLVIWAAALPVIMNPARGIATGGTAVGTIIKNANLYFFSWLALSANVFVAASLVQEHSGVNVRDIAKSAKNARWFGLAASSLVVMVSSIRVYQPYQCGPDTSPFCKRTKFAIAMGVLSFLYSSGLVYLLNKSLTLLAELIATSFLLVLWCFGVGFITFGSAPGATIGNLYFSTWISFILMVVIFAQCFRDFMGTVSLAKQQQSDNDDSGTDEEIPEPTSHVPELPPDEDI